MNGSEEASSHNPPPLRVLFYEPTHTGHHLAYLGRMLPGLFDLPLVIGLATTEEAVGSKEYTKSIASLVDRVEVMPVCRPRPRKKWQMWWQRYRECARLAREWRADHVCMVYADGIWQVVTMAGLLGVRLLPQRVALEGWVFRGGFTYRDATSWTDRMLQWLFRRALRQGTFTKLHLDDDLLFKFAQDVPRRKTEIALAPGPILLRALVSQTAARQQLGLPLEGRIVSISGMISQTKGALVAIDAFTRFVETSGMDDVRLAFIGPHHQNVRNRLAETPIAQLVEQGRIISIDRYLDENEMLLAAESSDLVLAAYLNHSGRSSILLWGGAAGRPVIGANRGTIEYVVESQRLGATCDVTNPDQFAATIAQMLEADWTEEDAERVRKHAQWHAIENYQRLSSELVRRRCGERAE